MRTLIRAVAVVGLLAGAMPFVATAGENQPAWYPFRAETASYVTRNQDQDFVRQWEANPPRGYPTLAKANIAATKVAIDRYEKIVKDGGWPKVPAMKLASGANGQAVGLLHERLLRSGDLKAASYYPTHFDYELERALKRFQATNGLSPTGVTDKRTIIALNISAETRLKQLKVNYNRLRADVKSDDARYLVVNIPAAQVEAVDDGRVVSRHAGVVGKEDRRTPIIDSHVHEINFNPIWRLPPTVVREDLIPKGRAMQKDNKDVLAAFGIDAYSNGRKLDSSKINWASGQPHGLSYSQKPGKENPLGFAKINFHNSYSVYLHDTPSDRLFGRNFRAASSGCVRVENIEQLIAWLLAGNEGWSKQDVLAIRKSGESKNVSLKRRVPLHMVYITAWATEDGVVQFRRDLYQKDGVGSQVASY